MDEEMQKSMFMAMLNYQQMLASAATQPTSAGSATSNGSNSAAASPVSITSANSPVQTPINGATSTPLLNLPKFCQDLLQQQAANGPTNGLSMASFLPTATDSTPPIPNPLAALFRASASSTPAQPTQEQVGDFRNHYF
jgi:hypothetical protein